MIRASFNRCRYQDGSEDEEEEQEAAWERVASSRLEGGGGGDAEAARARGDAAPLPGSLKQPLLGSMERAANGGASTSRGRAAPGERGPLTLHGSASAASVAQAPFPELSPLQCLRSSSFWLLFAALTISMGSGEIACAGCGPVKAPGCAGAAGGALRLPQPPRA